MGVANIVTKKLKVILPDQNQYTVVDSVEKSPG